MAKNTLVPFERLAEQFERLPGIGYRSARRIAYYILSLPEGEAEKLSGAIVEAREKIHHCPVCYNLTDMEKCGICSDPDRDRSVICVVESFRDVSVIELMDRLRDGTVKEVVMATNATIEGETTASYISKLIKPLGIRVTRLATGIPAGGNIEYSDEITLARAFNLRLDM